VKGKKASAIVLKAMGSTYQAMVEAKENIMNKFNNNETKYKQIIDIVDRRRSIQLHHPLHAAGHYLNPKYFYSNPLIENDNKLLDGLYYVCIDKLSTNTEFVDSIHGELSTYRMGEGHFGWNTTTVCSMY
jgi:hypothetical protein